MYKEIFNIIIQLLTQPGKTWAMLAEKEGENKERFLSRFIYPLIGLVTLAAFLGIVFTRKEFDVQLALKASIRSLIAAFCGFYLVAYLMNEIWNRLFKREKAIDRWMMFVGYSSSLMFLLNIVLMLLPEFFFLRIFVLYTFYLVWEGAEPFMQVMEEEKIKFVSITTVLLLAIPYVIEKALFLLMPGLQF